MSEIGDAADEAAPVRVLLVDDNEQWARFVADELAARDERFDVAVATSANEAMATLDDGAVDCVVADYRMPEVDGIELTERIRDRRPSLPVVLVTGEGDEDVASRALDAGATDYIRKEPRTDQTPLFADRIDRAVRQHRLRARIRESERRYRTIIEGTREAMAIVREGRIEYANRRLAELTGVERAELRGREFVADLVAEADRDRVRAVVGGTAGDDAVHEVRIVPRSGSTRHCEFTRERLEWEGDPAALLSIRDVTTSKRRERALRRVHDLGRIVQEILVDSRTRPELEAAIVAGVCDHGYDLAWIGEAADGGLRPRAVAGDESYVDRLRELAGEGAASGEPGVSAARTGETQYVRDVETLFPTEWRALAKRRGYRTGLALPLSHEGVDYGVLAVYHDAPGRIDEFEREALAGLADTIAFAVHHLETRRALNADYAVDVTVRLEGEGYYLLDVLSAGGLGAPDAEVTVRGTHPRGDDAAVQYVAVSGVSPERFREAALAHDAVEEVAVLETGTPARCAVTVADRPPESRLARRGAAVGPTTVAPTGARLRFELPDRGDLRSIVEGIERRYGTATVRSCVERDRTAEGGESAGADDLTEKQAAALRAAFHHGYFETPREHSASEVADALDVAHSTFLEHLRTAQQKVFADRFLGEE